MHWPLCNATNDAVPTFVSHRALCGLAAPITTIFREAKRGRPSSSSSPWRSARGVRARAFASCAPLGLASQRALRRAAGGRRRARRRSRAALFCGSAALWFLAAVRRVARLVSPGRVAGLEIQYRWTAVRDQEAARRAATPDQSLSSKSVPSPFPTLMFEKSGESSSPAMALEESPRSSRLRVKASAVRH